MTPPAESLGRIGSPTLASLRIYLRDEVALSNLGWTILRIPAWRCYEELDAVIDEIRKMRDRLLDEAPCQARRLRGH